MSATPVTMGAMGLLNDGASTKTTTRRTATTKRRGALVARRGGSSTSRLRQALHARPSLRFLHAAPPIVATPQRGRACVGGGEDVGVGWYEDRTTVRAARASQAKPSTSAPQKHGTRHSRRGKDVEARARAKRRDRRGLAKGGGKLVRVGAGGVGGAAVVAAAKRNQLQGRGEARRRRLVGRQDGATSTSSSTRLEPKVHITSRQRAYTPSMSTGDDGSSDSDSGITSYVGSSPSMSSVRSISGDEGSSSESSADEAEAGEAEMATASASVALGRTKPKAHGDRTSRKTAKRIREERASQALTRFEESLIKLARRETADAAPGRNSLRTALKRACESLSSAGPAMSQEVEAGLDALLEHDEAVADQLDELNVAISTHVHEAETLLEELATAELLRQERHITLHERMRALAERQADERRALLVRFDDDVAARMRTTLAAERDQSRQADQRLRNSIRSLMEAY